MATDNPKAVQTGEASQKLTFFRQGGWMMVATVGSGVLMFLVQLISQRIADNEYSMVLTMLQLLNLMTIPTLGLQNIFAQQTSRAVTDSEKRVVVGTFKAVMKGAFCLWLAMMFLLLIFRAPFVKGLNISNPTVVWITVTTGLLMLWQPILQGMLQGRQNFLWLGWVSVFNGVGRLSFAFAVVFAIHGGATGIMTGALVGLATLVIVAGWQTRDLWTAPSGPFEGRPWFRRVVPLTLGSGSSQFLFSADLLFVGHYFHDKAQVAGYGFGMTLARAIVLFTAPLVAVMFPKIVQSAARSQKSNVMKLTIFGTGLLAVSAAVCLPFALQLGIKMGFLKADYAWVVGPMPLFAWSMVPLAIGNVFLNNLLARAEFSVVPWLVGIASGYGITLMYRHDSFQQMVQTLALFNVLMLSVCAFFTWRGSSAPQHT